MSRLRALAAMSAATAAILLLLTADAAAAPPGEVSGVAVSNSQIAWTSVPGSDDYNVYRGVLSWLRTGDGAECFGNEIAATSFAAADSPPVGQGYFYLVTAEANANGEGTAGTGTGGSARPLRSTCDVLMKHHLEDRIGFGEDDWSRGRIATLGFDAYLNEQLDPASIDETSNTTWATKHDLLTPPLTLSQLQALDVINAVYSRRQLEEQATLFWDNHFNTDWRESYSFFAFYQALFPDTQAAESVKLHYDAQNAFRSLAFNGTFRDILEASGLGPAMIIYLDTNSNVAIAPNENYGRELLELHTMGVDGGYTQQDVVQLAKVFSGWNVCKKAVADAGDPLSACIAKNLYGTANEPPGVWVSNFRTAQHDRSQKILFQGTPYQAIIPATTGNPAAGVNDAELAYNAIVAHPSTPKFIAKKLLQRFVDENPSQAMIDAVVVAWNNPANPHGVGDLREVLRAVLAQSAFRDPAHVGDKIKTPFEHVVSGLRAIRGKTDGFTTVSGYLGRMQEAFHNNSVPTGYSEIGGDWLDTNNLLERQNFGFDVATHAANTFGSDVIGLLNANGISTSPTPNNAAAIVDFLSNVMFGGALTAAEKQRAVTYLNTNDSGATNNYNDARIREAAGLLLGYAQFLEQ